MAARKLQHSIDRCFEKVVVSVARFEVFYEKITQSNNPAQKDKLEDNLKREIKKLHRLRDQINTWAIGNDIKDTTLLLEHQKLIEIQMKRFKAIEKASKASAYSKKYPSTAAKLDPEEEARVKAGEFLSSMADELERQIEALESEGESIQATMKKGNNNKAKAKRITEVEHIIERHKWHQGRLELIQQSLESGDVDTDQVNDLEESIRYYVAESMNGDFIEDDEMYDELDLENDKANYYMNQGREIESCSSFGSTDTGVSHPPGTRRKGKKAIGMSFSQFLNLSRGSNDDLDENNTHEHNEPADVNDDDGEEDCTSEAALQEDRIETTLPCPDKIYSLPLSQSNNGQSGITNAHLAMLAPLGGTPTRKHWKLDAESLVCNEVTCKRSFNYFTRRHHCRKCGNIFCGSHSAFFVPLDQDAGFNTSAPLVRACGDCFGEFRVWCKRNMNEVSKSTIDPD